MALCLKEVNLSYGRGKSKVKALSDVTLTVPAGSIFGLLGPSGCGKTSIIAVSLGLRNVDSGKVLIFGKGPSDKDSGVPGSVVGYMPQNLALHEYFTALEILLYYARIFQVEERKRRANELLMLLDLKDGKTDKRQISKLSGGQKRRVSLACALVHKPKLLIL